MIRRIAVAAVVVLVAAGGSVPAGAADLAMAVTVENPQITVDGGPGGSCDWEVLSKVRVVNLTSDPITLTAVDSFADFGGNSNGHVPAAMINNGGLVVGAVVPSGAVSTFYPVTTAFTLPCSSSEGQVEFRLMSSAGTGSGDAPFIAGGTTVPTATVFGAAGLTVLLALVLIVRQRRHRSVAAPL